MGNNSNEKVTQGDIIMIVWKNHRIDFRYLNDNSIIIDAGSCRGSFIDFIRKHLNCKIYAIEPCKTHVEFLNSKNYLNVKVFNKALVGKSIVKYINFNEYVGLPEWGSIYNRNIIHPKLKKVISYDVEVINVNDVFKVLGIDYIDYLKLDIEGAEHDVINSMFLETASKIRQISIEVHGIPGSSSTHNDFVASLKDSITNLGYRFTYYTKNKELWCVRE